MNYGNRKFGYYLNSGNKKHLAALQDYVLDRDIYCDIWSSKERTGLKDLFGHLCNGDTIYFYSLDNIFDNSQLLKQMLETLKNNNITIHILDLPSSLAEASYSFDDELDPESIIINLLIDLTNKAVSKEKQAAQHIQALGFADAKARGVRLGRRPKPLPESFTEDYRAWKNGECTAASIYKRYGWSNPCFYRKVKDYERAMYA